jgi:hypothetical protein
MEQPDPGRAVGGHENASLTHSETSQRIERIPPHVCKYQIELVVDPARIPIRGDRQPTAPRELRLETVVHLPSLPSVIRSLHASAFENVDEIGLIRADEEPYSRPRANRHIRVGADGTIWFHAAAPSVHVQSVPFPPIPQPPT